MGNRRVESFVVRIVVRGDAASEDGWGGRIQHIATGDECQFNQLEDLLSFMSLHLREQGQDPNTVPLGKPLVTGE